MHNARTEKETSLHIMIEAAADLQPISASVSTVAVLQLTTVVVHLSLCALGGGIFPAPPA